MRRAQETSGFACIATLALAHLAACSSGSQNASSAFSFPIDFSYACEGDGHTVAPQNDETAATLSATRMCPDLADGGQGDLFGVVLDRQPPQLMVLQMNPASGERRLIDVDYFVPGVTGVPVGPGPLRVLRAPDWSAFYVVSAGEARIDRIVLGGLVGDTLSYTRESIALPGTPIEAEVLGDQLVIAARDAAELWVFDLAGDPAAPALTVVATPDRIEHLAAIDDHWLVTFRSRPTVAILDASGAILAEKGLVPECRDTLDDDGDGLVDKADPDCRDFIDDDESPGTGAERADAALPASSFEGAPSCDNGVDDDLDGATDFPEDLACDELASEGELLAECDDGIDQDGDGLTDLADETCYAAWNNQEGQAPDDGPFHPAFIDGGVHGRFVYVLDERAGEIVVHDYVEGALSRVDVNATDAEPPALESVDFDDVGASGAEVEEDLAIPAIRPPATRRQRVRNIQITDTNASSLSSQRLRGEVWERIIEAADGESPSVSLTPNSVEWKPPRCATTSTDRCVQPALDDATWFAFGANLDGRIQLIEAIRRGTPMHRLAERVGDPSQRVHDVTAPRLLRRGALVNGRGEPQVGLPFIGAALEEQLAERVVLETPSSFRRFGVWPAADREETPTESWSITYQGRIPGASGALGHLVDASHFADAEGRFCEHGVAPGDILQLVVPVASSHASLQHAVPVLAGEAECPVRAPEIAVVEVTVSEVGMTELVIDPTSARLRPLLPVLDREAIDAQRLSLRSCQDAVEEIDETLGLPERLAPLSSLEPSLIPMSVNYAVRAAEWAFVGGRSGFLHRQRWDRTSGTCQVDETLDARLTGRASEVPDAVAKYVSCPPPADQLDKDAVTAIAPESGRFVNPSFSLDIFPACENLPDGTIAEVPSQQDTSITFSVNGPHQGSALSVSDSLSVTGVPLMDFRRQQVQLDPAAKRAAVLQFRPGDAEVIVVFE